MGYLSKEAYKKAIVMLSTILGVYLSMRYLVPLLLPFLIAAAVVMLIYPRIDKIHKKTHIGKGILTGGFLLLLAGICLGCVFLVCGKLFCHVGDLITAFNQMEEEACCVIRDCCNYLEKQWGIQADAMEYYVVERVTIFAQNIEQQVFPNIMGASVLYAKEIIGVAVSAVVTVIAILLLVKDYDKIKQCLQSHKSFRMIYEIVYKIGGMLGVFVKAEGIILLSIAVISTLGYWLIGVRNPIGIGLLTGFLDLLPFIGTGIILIPLSIILFLQGNIGQGIGSIVLYVICSLTREFLEPKLIGDRMGIWPIAILMTIYLGIKLYGLGGIVLGPLSILLIIEIHKRLTDN
ncbi:MAG: AI-2E family transporter [Lachnospiraceae bacterium]